MAFLAAAFGSPLRARVLERLLRGGPANLGQLAKDLEASRQNVSRVVDELAALQLVREEAGSDRRATFVRANEAHPFIEPLRILAQDGSEWYEDPTTWQTLLARRHERDCYIGGYAAIRRVLQPIDFDAPNVLVNTLHKAAKPHATAAIERATGTRIRLRTVARIPPEVIPLQRGDVEVWFATADRGFVEAWTLKELQLYGLFLCLVQGLRDGVLDADGLLEVGRHDGAEGEIRTLLAAVRKHLPLGETRASVRGTRPLTAKERLALGQALNTVVG